MRPINPHHKSFLELGRFLSLEIEMAGSFSGVSTNTSYIEQGDLFIALPGAKSHGAAFASTAAEKGAVAILTDEEGAKIVDAALPIIIAHDPRKLAADVASWFYGRPFLSMHSIGITGTNGKTTTASLLFQLWRLQQRSVGMIGTTGVAIDSDLYPTSFTTPEGTELQAIAATMRERCLTHLVMEVSSHALSQKRMVGTKFKVAAFTNLTQDHLDFHGTMENYFNAKALLFTQEYSEAALINIDDPWGVKLLDIAATPTQTVSRENKAADWHYTAIHPITHGYEVSIRGTGGILIEGRIPLVGLHNLDNALMAVALGVTTGLDPLAVGEDLSRLVGAPGRLESVDLGQKFLALVDYAHTPDAVIRSLRAVREITSGRVIAVLGCGGDRDATKRPLMGDALVEGSDLSIFTSDNPRGEDPTVILAAMSNGRTDGENVIVEIDRRGAIAIAVSEATAGDTVIILGKGHETGQDIAGVKYPFDDRLELARAIETLS